LDERPKSIVRVSGNSLQATNFFYIRDIDEL